MRMRKVMITLLLAASVGAPVIPADAAGIERNENVDAIEMNAEEESGSVIEQEAEEDAAEDADWEEDEAEDADWEEEDIVEDADWEEDEAEDIDGNWEIAVDYDGEEEYPIECDSCVEEPATVCFAPADEVQEEGAAGMEITTDEMMADNASAIDHYDEADTERVEYAQSKDDKVAGTYVSTDKIQLYSGAGENSMALAEIAQNAQVQCYGYYTQTEEEMWLYVQYIQSGTVKTGFCKIDKLK